MKEEDEKILSIKNVQSNPNITLNKRHYFNDFIYFELEIIHFRNNN